MIVDSLSYIFSNTRVNVRISSIFSDSWVTTRGVRQGGVLSIFLFSPCLDDIVTEISAMPVGCRLGINKINVQTYADDIILFSPTAGGFQQLLDRIVILVEQNDLLIINADKTKIMVFRPGGKFRKHVNRNFLPGTTG